MCMGVTAPPSPLPSLSPPLSPSPACRLPPALSCLSHLRQVRDPGLSDLPPREYSGSVSYRHILLTFSCRIPNPAEFPLPPSTSNSPLPSPLSSRFNPLAISSVVSRAPTAASQSEDTMPSRRGGTWTAGIERKRGGPAAKVKAGIMGSEGRPEARAVQRALAREKVGTAAGPTARRGSAAD